MTKSPIDRVASNAPCPYLGRAGDPDTRFIQPHPAHRCQATDPASGIPLDDQRRYCYGDAASCARFIPLDALGHRATPRTSSPAMEPGRAGREAGPGRPGESPRGDGDGTAWRGRLGRLSFEEWVVYVAAGAILTTILYFLLVARSGDQAPAAATGPGAPGAASTGATMATTPSATATAPGASPTATADQTPAAPVDAAPFPTPPAGGLVAVLSPSERGVASFNERDRLPEYGVRNLRVGRFEDRTYIGGILFPLNKIPKGSRVTHAQLELTGLSDTNVSGDGAWTVELLDPEAADEWSNLTFETLDQAPASQQRAPWRLGAADLAARRTNVLAFSDDARDLLMQRLEQGRLAFRVRGPRGGGDDLFTWDTGFGQGFGMRPALRVALVPPPPTPGPPPGQAGRPTPLPLIVWVAEPTPAPTATPLPAEVPGALAGMILFQSDRFGRPSLMVYDVARGRVGQVTQSWPYLLAQRRQLAAGSVAVRVESRPCGGETYRRDGADVLVDPGDPARDCAQLVVPNPDGGPAREITESGYRHYDPAVSADGQWIVYVSTIAGNDEIFKIRPDGTGNTRLTENVWEWDKHPSWSPDGGQVVFWSNRDGRKQLYLMNADGSGARSLSANAFNDWDPVWVR